MKIFFRWLITLLWALLIWRLTTTPDFRVTDDSFLSWLLSNGGHLIFFGILALFLKLNQLSTNYCVLITSIYGLAIELVQRGIPGRSFNLFDWALDTLGAIVFLAIIKKYENPRHGWGWLHWRDHS